MPKWSKSEDKEKISISIFCNHFNSLYGKLKKGTGKKINGRTGCILEEFMITIWNDFYVYWQIKRRQL